MSNLVNNVIEEIVTQMLIDGEMNESIIVTYEYSFMEHFKKDISDDYVYVC